MNLQEYFILLSNLPIPIVLGYALWHYRKLKNEFLGIIFFAILSFAIQLPSVILYLMGVNNLFLLHLYVPLSFVALSLFYYRLFDGFINPKLLRAIAILFVLISTLNSIFIQPLQVFNSYALSLESMILIIYAISLYVLLLNEEVREAKREHLKALLWINSGIFIYHSSGLLLFYFGELLTNFTPYRFRISWLFHSFIYVVLFTFIFVGLWKYPRK